MKKTSRREEEDEEQKEQKEEENTWMKGFFLDLLNIFDREYEFREE